MARAADVQLEIADFQKVADRTPYLCDLRCVYLYCFLFCRYRVFDSRISSHCPDTFALGIAVYLFISNLEFQRFHSPSGHYVMEDLHKVGGIPALVKYLLKNTDLIDGSQLTVTGKTLAENYEDVPELDFANQSVVRSLEDPIKKVCSTFYGLHGQQKF